MASKELIAELGEELHQAHFREHAGKVMYIKGHFEPMAETVLKFLLEYLQETTTDMEQAHDLAHAKAETVFAETSDVWRAMLNASPLGEQSE